MSLDGFLELDNDKLTGLLIVDFSQIVISTIQATFRPQEELSVDLIRHVVLNSIRSNILRYRREYPDIVLATDRGPYWRKRIASYYKGNRSKQRDESGWDWKVIFDAMNVVRQELIETFPYHTIEIAGVEADDIAGVLVHRYAHLYHRILLLSSDGDWAQLLKFRNVKQFSPLLKKPVEPKQGSAHLHLLEKVIRGDRKDAIANIKSVSDHVVNLVGVRQKSITQKELDIWMNNPVEDWAEDQFTKDRYYENLKLLDLSLIPDDIADLIVAEFEKPIASGGGIYKYLIKHKMKELLGKADEFL